MSWDWEHLEKESKRDTLSIFIVSITVFWMGVLALLAWVIS